ncbi:hypothetical protein [Longirhabdus pacifica]|uniref:hypothetical protein n=1 Tax=Longirhabdus pacifica TaxID=2305227 RepID=UPI0010092D8C|nr:hypothetical protein [Longirhabdus pacifica]
MLKKKYMFSCLMIFIFFFHAIPSINAMGLESSTSNIIMMDNDSKEIQQSNTDHFFASATTSQAAQQLSPLVTNFDKVILTNLDNETISQPSFKDALQKFDDCIDPNSLSFDFNKALNIVNSDPSLELVTTLDKQLKSGDPNVDVLTSGLDYLITNQLQATLDDTQKSILLSEIRNQINYTFNNMHVTNKNYVFYYSRESKSDSNYYHLLFAFQNENTIELIPISLEIQAYRFESWVVGFIPTTDSALFSVHVRSLKVTYDLS